MSDAKLWLVEIDEDDWDYDRFAEAAVWAETAEEAEALMRAAPVHPDRQDDMWIESPEWRLRVRPAPTGGVVLVHWHAG